MAPNQEQQEREPEAPPTDPEEPLIWEPEEPGDLQMRQPISLMAVFRDAGQAQACAGALRSSGLNATVTVLPVPPGPTEETGERSSSESGLSTGVTLGAGIGATAGMLAATYVFPGLDAPLISVSPTVTTLAGAGLGTLLAGLADGKSEGAGAAAIVAVHVAGQDAQRAEALVRRFKPVRVEEAAP